MVIKEAAAPLNRLAEENFWTYPDQEKFEFLRTQIKPLFRTVSNTDFKAMRFEKDVLEVSIAQLSNDKKRFDALRSNVIAQIGELPLSVHIVKRVQDLIEQSQKETFWANVSDEALDLLVEKLSPLMKFREKDNPLSPIELDLKDKVKQKEFIEFGPQHEAVSVTRYKEMVETKILALMENNPVLLKIKENRAVSETDIQTLVQVLTDAHPHITEDLLKKVYQHPKAGFIQFIRHILGVEPLESFSNIVTKAFDQFIKSHTDLNSRQLEFLRLLKEFILEREKVEKKDLIQSPFTVIHPQGIRGVFSPAVINEILSLTEELAA